MDRDINSYSKKEFLDMENFEPCDSFSEIILVPTSKKHDSGYRSIKFILAKRGKIVGVVSGWSDVIHLNGIGGNGIDFQHPKYVDWRIDCLPKSGCMRLFSSNELTTDNFIGSDFCVYVK